MKILGIESSCDETACSVVEDGKTVLSNIVASQIDEHASEADIILLTPTFAYAKEEIEKKFPQIPVIAISKAEYGTMDLDHLWKKIKTVL